MSPEEIARHSTRLARAFQRVRKVLRSVAVDEAGIDEYTRAMDTLYRVWGQIDAGEAKESIYQQILETGSYDIALQSRRQMYRERADKANADAKDSRPIPGTFEHEMDVSRALNQIEIRG